MDSQPNRRKFQTPDQRYEERKELDQLTRQSDQADLQSDWNMEAEMEDQIKDQSTQRNHDRLEILQKGEQPTIQKF